MRHILPAISAAAAIFIFWTSLRQLTNCSYPIFVVSSESMEPTFYRGDVILLSNRRHSVQVGDIPVVWFQGRPLPMVHRAVKVTNNTSQDGSRIEWVGLRLQEDNADWASRQQILTKGDNNEVDDTILYPEGRLFVRREEIVGLVWGHVPYIGRFSIVAREYPWVLYALLVVHIFFFMKGVSLQRSWGKFYWVKGSC